MSSDKLRSAVGNEIFFARSVEKSIIFLLQENHFLSLCTSSSSPQKMTDATQAIIFFAKNSQIPPIFVLKKVLTPLSLSRPITGDKTK